MIPMNLEFVKDLWLPNIFIYNLKTYKVIDVLSKLAGLWIDTNKYILYSQATHIRSEYYNIKVPPIDIRDSFKQIASFMAQNQVPLFLLLIVGNQILIFMYIQLSKTDHH